MPSSWPRSMPARTRTTVLCLPTSGQHQLTLPALCMGAFFGSECLALARPMARFHVACNYSTCLLRLNRPEEALVQIETALGLKPDWSDLFIPRAVVLRNLGAWR